MDGSYDGFAVLNDLDLDNFRKSIVNVPQNKFNEIISDLIISSSEKLKVITGGISKSIVIAGKFWKLAPGKTNTILGRFNPDISRLFEELGSFKNVGLGESQGGINLLNRPNHYPYSDPRQWWEQFNHTWLERAVNRADDIYLATPVELERLFDVTNNRVTTYALEIRYLVQKDVKPTNLSTAEWEQAKLIVEELFN